MIAKLLRSCQRPYLLAGAECSHLAIPFVLHLHANPSILRLFGPTLHGLPVPPLLCYSLQLRI